MPKPRAILAISAHWHVDALAVTAMPNPRTIHDFYGFPQALFDVLRTATAIDHTARYPTAKQFRRALEAILATLDPSADVPLDELIPQLAAMRD